MKQQIVRPHILHLFTPVRSTECPGSISVSKLRISVSKLRISSAHVYLFSYQLSLLPSGCNESKMHPAANYSVSQYPGTSASSSKQRRTSQTINSAFSACANPNEDWTQISDFGKRRLIQSRIAQRNYRK